MPSIGHFPPKQRAKPAKLRYDEKTGQPLYPYAPNECDQIDLVGFRLENGEYLPTKVFVRGNFGVGEKQLKRMLLKRFALGVFVGRVISMAMMVVVMVG
jgi:hypothetical protein